jgi:hypothetical protein
MMDKAAHPFALVVDDEELLRLFAGGLLEEHGFEVMETENAAAERRIATCGYFIDIQITGALNATDSRGQCKVSPCASRDYFRAERAEWRRDYE